MSDPMDNTRFAPPDDEIPDVAEVAEALDKLADDVTWSDWERWNEDQKAAAAESEWEEKRGR